MSPQTESYIMAAQELALFTRWHEKNILKTIDSDSCRVCQSQPEKMSHILSGCDTLAKKEYLERHNGVAQYVHHAICQSYKIQTCAKWHVHKPPEVIMLKNVEITYDSVIATDRPYVFNRPVEPCEEAFSPRFRRDFDAPLNRHATSVSGWRENRGFRLLFSGFSEQFYLLLLM